MRIAYLFKVCSGQQHSAALAQGHERRHAPGAVVLQGDPQVCLGRQTGHAFRPFNQAYAVVEVRPAQEFELIG
mgnify:CR=1 FL=1